MKTDTISEVEWSQLKCIADDRGAVLHMVRSDSLGQTGFGEIYFSLLNLHITKGWKMHYRMTQRLTVPFGLVRFALYDAREDSVTRGNIVSRLIGRPDDYGLLKIPPGVWYAFQNVGQTIAVVANCADIIHDPSESTTMPLNNSTIRFNWG